MGRNYQTLNIAHRGARSLAPENTLMAAQKALAVGADGWELDVRVTADGIPLVIHDETLERTSNVAEVFPHRRPWLVHMLTLAEIRQLDFGSWFLEQDPFGQMMAGTGWLSPDELETYRGISAPTLAEALAFTRTHQWYVHVEIKDLSNIPGADTVVEKVVYLIEEMGMINQVTISSFYHPYLVQVKRLNPKIKTGVLVSEPQVNPIALVQELKAQAYHPAEEIVRPPIVSELHQQEIALNIWTVNHEQLMHRWIKAQVDAIFTDYPHLLTHILTE